MKICKTQKELISYADAYGHILMLNQKLQDLRTQQQAVELNVLTFKLCRREGYGNSYELWNMNWGRYDTIGGRLLNKGDQLSITVAQPDRQVTYIGTVIDVTTKLAVRLMPSKDLDVNTLIKWRDAEETHSDTVKFSETANNDALKDAQIYCHYNVWKFPSDARVILSASNNWVATKRMLKAVEQVENEIKAGSKFFKLLLGYIGDRSLEECIKAFSRDNLPQINVEEEIQTLQREVQDTLGMGLNSV